MKNMIKDVDIIYTYVCYYKRYPNTYSPMFDKVFKDMTDEEIRQQLDLWIEESEHLELFEYSGVENDN